MLAYKAIEIAKQFSYGEQIKGQKTGEIWKGEN